MNASRPSEHPSIREENVFVLVLFIIMLLVSFNGRPDVIFFRPCVAVRIFHLKLSGSHSPDVLCFLCHLPRKIALTRASFDDYDFHQSCAVKRPSLFVKSIPIAIW